MILKLVLSRIQPANCCAMRMCIAQTNTDYEHVLQAWKTIQETAVELENMFNNKPQNE